MTPACIFAACFPTASPSRSSTRPRLRRSCDWWKPACSTSSSVSTASTNGRTTSSSSGGKRDTLVPTEFDGEGRFRRDGSGEVRDFVYYEFGRRLGVARKI